MEASVSTDESPAEPDKAQDCIETVSVAKIATFRTAFPAAFGCPRQGLAAPSSRGRVELESWLAASNNGDASAFLDGLEGFSHLWVVFLFDQNKHSQASFSQAGSFLRPTVRPPWLADEKGNRASCGVFATRSPHRPNPIGLTVCKLDALDKAGGIVYLSGVDAVDGTAVLDLKPYHPIDMVVPLPGDSPPQAKALPVKFPSWLPKPQPRVAVSWLPSALEELEALQPTCSFYPDGREALVQKLSDPLDLLRQALEEVLGLDPRTPQARNRVARGDTETTNTYFAAYYDTLSIAFRSLPASSCSSATPTDGVRFEVVKVEQLGESLGRSSKLWLDGLRTSLEAAAEKLAVGGTGECCDEAGLTENGARESVEFKFITWSL